MSETTRGESKNLGLAGHECSCKRARAAAPGMVCNQWSGSQRAQGQEEVSLGSPEPQNLAPCMRRDVLSLLSGPHAGRWRRANSGPYAAGGWLE